MRERSSRWSQRLLNAAAGIAAVQAAALLLWYWPGALPDTNTSGVWIALAHDFAHGDFFRALTSDLGTGGTRYMPLFVLLHGTAIKLGASALGSGVLLTLLSAVAMVAAVYVLLRAIDTPTRFAGPVSLLLLGTVSLQLMLLTVRGDFLAAALNLAGIAATVIAQRKNDRRAALLGAALFAAAFLTKFTTLFGLAAMLGWLIAEKQIRAALTLAVTSGVLMMGGLLVANGASDGRMLQSFAAVANGGMTWDAVMQGPVRFATECAHDPLSIVLFLTAALSACMLSNGDPGRRIVLWCAGATLLVTWVIFLSPGTSANHLMDLQAASLLAIAAALSAAGAPRVCALVGVGVFAAGMCATWLPGVPSIPKFFERNGRPRISDVREAFSRRDGEPYPILAENPLIPILAGERPIVADWFNFRLLWRRDPQVRDAMLARVRAAEFGTVVLSNWPPVFTEDADFIRAEPSAEQLRSLLARDDLPDGLGEALMAHYRIAEVRRPYIYLAPRTGKVAHE